MLAEERSERQETFIIFLKWKRTNPTVVKAKNSLIGSREKSVFKIFLLLYQYRYQNLQQMTPKTTRLSPQNKHPRKYLLLDFLR